MADVQSANSKATTGIVHDFDKNSSIITTKFLGILLGVIVLGILTGFVVSRMQNQPVTSSSVTTNSSGQAEVKKGDVFGTNDISAFKDTAEGKLANGGQDGEGQYHLVRPGGDSQNVYLTSSTVDLSKLIGHQIKVWGATQTAQHVGWLMDVGKVEVED